MVLVAITSGFLVLQSGQLAQAAQEIKVYNIPKESPPATMPPGHAATDGHGHAQGTTAMPQVTYTTPEGWTDMGRGDMRVAGFAITGTNGLSGQVAVTPLPGMEGREALIVNMWRQQVGQSELSETDAAKELTEVEIAGETGQMFEISGPSPAGATSRLVTAMLHRDGQSWFFKLQGDDELVKQQRANFLAFLKSVKIEAAPAGGLPAGHPPIAGSTMPGAVNTQRPPAPRQGGPRWTVPENWKEIDGGQFLFAKFVVAGQGGAEAMMNVSMSSGSGGGLGPNVNRWRGQLGLGAWSDAELNQNVTELTTEAGPADYVELSGTSSDTEKPAMILGAKVTTQGNTWFYKLMGDPGLVSAQKDAFLQFVKTVQY